MAVILHGVLEARLGTTLTATQDAIADAAIVDATALVEGYLGYAIEQNASISETVSGNGTPHLMIKHKQINSVTSITYVPDSSTIDSDTYRIAPCGCAVMRIDGYTWEQDYANYTVVYNGGWAADDIPQLLKTVIGEIALMLYNNYSAIGVDAVRVGEVSYKYSETARDFILSDAQKKVLNKYKCRRVG